MLLLSKEGKFNSERFDQFLARLAATPVEHAVDQYGFLGHLISMGSRAEDIYVLMLHGERLVASFDASGQDNSECLAVAGFISSLKDWADFHVAWTGRLQEDNLTHFHMTDFAYSWGEFKEGWKDNEERRRSLLADLIGIIRSHCFHSFGCVVENKHFDKLSESNKEEFRLCAFSLAARTCVGRVSEYLRDNGLSHVRVGYVFEDGDKGKGHLIDLMVRDRYRAPFFASKKERIDPQGQIVESYPPLQAADILAYELALLFLDASKPHRDQRYPNPSRWRWAMKELYKAPPLKWGYYQASDLNQLNEKLDSLIEEANPIQL